MLIVYDSRTGMGKKFAEKLPYPSQPVSQPVQASCILVTRNAGLGQVPKTTELFLQQYAGLVKGVVVNGSKRFGRFYCAAGPKITSRYRLPVIHSMQGEGTDEDVRSVAEFIREYEAQKERI